MKNLKLNMMASENLSKVEMSQVRGGEEKCCSCSCAYANSGGSSTGGNASANFGLGPAGGKSITGDNATTVCVSFG